MNNTVFEKYYSEMDLENLIKLSNTPGKLNINGIPSLINELDKRSLFELKESVSSFYFENTNIDVENPPKKLKINGWLTILSIGLFVNIIKSIIFIYKDIPHLLSQIKTKDNNLIELYKNEIYQLMGVKIFISFMCLILIYMMLSFKKSFPKTMIAFIIISIFISIYFATEHFTMSITDNEKLLLFAQGLFGGVWIVYLSISDYIKETFIK